MTRAHVQAAILRHWRLWHMPFWRTCGLAALAWVIGASTALAQQVTMRSGAHDGYTRLALDIPQDLSWSGEADATEAIYRVTFDRPGYSIDLDRVFDRIDRARVASVRALPQGAGVEVSLGCDCRVDASEFEGRMIVLDIRPRDPTEPISTSVSDDVEADRGMPQNTSRPAPALGLGILPEPSASRRVEALLPRFSPGGSGIGLQPEPDEPNPARETPEDRQIAEEFGRALAEQLAQGATQGVLEPEGPIIPRPLPTETPQSADADDNRPMTEAPPLSAEMQTSSPSRGFGASSVLRIGGQSACISDARLDLPGWFGAQGEAGALAAMGQLRTQLMGEFDRIDRRVQRDLAQLYISLGFGAEARALLQLDDSLPDPLLMTLATLSEGGRDPAGVFAGQSECQGRAALWALLGARALPNNSEIAEAAILRAFEELPQSLRRALGPRLAERFAEEGRLDAARNVLSRLGRALGRVTEDMRLAAARIARASGEPEEAEDLLASLLAAPGELGVAAAVESIDLATEQGRSVDPGLVDLTAAYSTERRTTETRAGVWLSHVRAAWANAEFDRAFEEISTAEGVDPDIRRQARNEALRALSEEGGDGAFLRRAVERENIALASAYPRTAALMANRLLGLGLPAEAGRWLEGPTPPGQDRTWRVLQARRSLGLRNPEEAEIALIGLQGDDILRLRAEAREMMGDYDFALDAYETLGDAEGAARLAWLAGDFSAVSESGDPLLAAMAELSEPEAGAAASDLPQEPSLSQGRALAESGQTAVETIRALLAQTALPDP